MSLPQVTRARAEEELARFCATHIPPRARDQIRLETRWRADAVTLFERRPPWRRGLGTEWTQHPIAQFRYLGGVWRVYWRRYTGRWIRVEEIAGPEFGAVLRAVAKDRTGVFWG